MNVAGFHELIRQAQAGDQEAMDHLLVHLRPHLEHTARMCLQGADDASASASDLVQESWLRAWDRLGQFAGGTNDDETLAMFRAWTSRIVRSLCLQARRDRLRTKRSAPRGKLVRLGGRGPGASSGSRGWAEPAASGSTPSAGARREEEALKVRTALDRLPDAVEREVVRLRFFEGLSLREISECLGLSYDQARERFHRGMGRFEAEMGQEP